MDIVYFNGTRMVVVAIAALLIRAGSALSQTAPPFNLKLYGTATVGVGGSTTLALTVDNPSKANYTAGSGTLPGDQVISTPNALLSAWAPAGSAVGAIEAVAGTNGITFGACTILAGGAYAFPVNVTRTAPDALLKERRVSGCYGR